MNLNELFLNDFHTATIFEMYALIFGFIIVGISFFLLILSIFKPDLFDHYKRGQIDAIKGKIKFELTKKDVWIKTKK